MLFIFTQINNYNDWTCEFMAKGQWSVFLITANKKETKYDYKPATSTESQDLWIFHTVSEAIQANMQQYSNKLILLVFFFCRTKIYLQYSFPRKEVNGVGTRNLAHPDSASSSLMRSRALSQVQPIGRAVSNWRESSTWYFSYSYPGTESLKLDKDKKELNRDHS